MLTISPLFAGLDEDLIQAAKNGDVKSVTKLLDRSANVHARDVLGNDAPLREAALNGHTETTRLLLDRGANVHAENDYALIWAADNGRTEIVILLLDRGADIHARDFLGSDVALRCAARNGHHHIVAMLELCYLRGFEEFRENPLTFIENQKHAELPVPPQLLLLWSIILDREEAFDQLNIISNTMDKHHMTALMYAALLGNESMCAKLVHAGAKINLKNEWGKTAIYLLLKLKGIEL